MLNLSNRQIRRERRRQRKKQARTNAQLKRRLFGDMCFAPCCYCLNVFFMDKLTIEHVIPRSLGGTNDDSNIALACAPCNNEKGREAWIFKKEFLKENYEQHSEQHLRQSWKESLQDSKSSISHCAGTSS